MGLKPALSLVWESQYRATLCGSVGSPVMFRSWHQLPTVTGVQVAATSSGMVLITKRPGLFSSTATTFRVL